MRIKLAGISIVLFLAATAFGGEKSAEIDSALAGVRSTDAVTVDKSIAELRGAGPEGLNFLLEQYDRHPDPSLIPAIDAVAQQRGAIWSRLFWYTDLASAEVAATQAHKPILYLRLMGKLTDEYSCANSRFFRTVLYSNQKVSAMLRDRFVLVWCSERPVPIITIDYGDGRTLRRTITGNSIHYVLDSSGRVLDALPGLFDPVSFQRILGQAATIASADEAARRKYLDRADDEILRQWRLDVAKADPQPVLPEVQAAAAKADAAAAMRLTVSKCAIETPLLRAMSPNFAAALDQSIASSNEQTWHLIAALHAADATLDAQSVAVIRGQNPIADADPAALDRIVQQFQKTIAEDSVRDNDQLRRQVLSWLRESNAPATVDDLNRRVYNELFLTPRSDAWLGLASQGLYTALTDDGCCVSASR